MKRVLKIVFPSIFLIFSSCSNSYENMIVKYNSKKFAPEHHTTEVTSIDDEGFEASKLLHDERYILPDGYEVSLKSPEASSYKWEVISKKIINSYTEPVEVRKTVCTEREYTFMPGKDFEIGTENKLILTVTDKSGTEYIDSAIIIITSWDFTSKGV